MRLHLSHLEYVVTFCAALSFPGCAAPHGGSERHIDLERIFTASGAPLKNFAWVSRYVTSAPAETLVTVDSTVGSDDGTVLERRQIGDSVVCDQLSFESGQVKRKRRYAFSDPAACETFDALLRMVRSSSDFILPGYNLRATPRFASCLIVTGISPSVLYVEGGVLRTQAALQQLRVWEDRLASKELIEDADLAVGLLGSGTFADKSILVVISVQAFDQICEIGSGASQSASHSNMSHRGVLRSSVCADSSSSDPSSSDGNH